MLARIAAPGAAALGALGGGLVVAVAAWIRNRTERAHTAAANRQTARYQQIIDGITDYAIFELDLDGRVRSWNDTAERVAGHSASEIVGRPLEIFHTAEDRASGWPLELCRRAAEHGRVADEGWRLRRDGSRYWAETTISAIQGPDGSVIGYGVVSRNVTERFRIAVDAAPNGMLMVDPGGNIVLINRQMESLAGYAPDELLGRSVDILVPKTGRHAHQDYRASFLAEPRTRSMGAGRDLFAVRKDGQQIPVEIGLNPVVRSNNTFVLASVIDIRERKRGEAELRRSNEELERFAYVASHDLQEPLRMVGSYVQLLAKRYRGRLDADADEFIGYALEGALRMQRLIEDLLAYSRLSTRGHALIPTDVNAVVARALADLKLAIDESGAVVVTEPLPTVLADAGQLGHVFRNLVSNALKFRGAKPPEIRDRKSVV